jgi:hypothetical protein
MWIVHFALLRHIPRTSVVAQAISVLLDFILEHLTMATRYNPGQSGLDATSLGSFSDLLLCWGHESMAFIRADSEAAEPIEPAALDCLTWSDST